jgi:hypothetical protein
MTHTLEILTLAALVTVTACDAPDRDVDDAAPRTKTLYTDVASLEALAESDSEIHDVMAAQLELSSDELLEIALDPAMAPDVVLTAPPAPTKSGSCVGLHDVLDFCYQKGATGVTVWVEVLGVDSPHQYLGLSGACIDGGLDVELASVDYAICTTPIPVPQVIIVAEACLAGFCDDVAYVKLFN